MSFDLSSFENTLHLNDIVLNSAPGFLLTGIRPTINQTNEYIFTKKMPQHSGTIKKAKTTAGVSQSPIRQSKYAGKGPVLRPQGVNQERIIAAVDAAQIERETPASRPTPAPTGSEIDPDEDLSDSEDEYAEYLKSQNSQSSRKRSWYCDVAGCGHSMTFPVDSFPTRVIEEHMNSHGRNDASAALLVKQFETESRPTSRLMERIAAATTVSSTGALAQQDAMTSLKKLSQRAKQS